MRKHNQTDPFGFTSAINNNQPIIEKRLYAEINDDEVGITAWYTTEMFPYIVEDVLKAGHKIIKVEARQQS